ncbi:MAG: hypothetical protein WA862_06250 [Solirubrobacterales bacterium]
MEKLKRNPPAWLLAVTLLVGGAMTLVLTWNMTFYQDTWAFLINRREITLDTVFAAHNEHIVAIPVLIEQLFLRLFGMGSARPEYVLLTLTLVGSAYLLFLYVKRRTDPWLAFFAAVLLLCLGPAYEVLLWPFEIGFIGSIFMGIAMLLALEREHRLWDAAACLLLVLSLGFSSLGLAFAAAALVALLQSPSGRRRARAYVFAVPAALFALWYLEWGHEAESHVSLANVFASPRFLVEGLASTLASLSGLGTSPYGTAPDSTWGVALLVVLIGGIGYWQLRKRNFNPGLWPAAAALAAYWLLAAFNQIPGREPHTSRYQYAGAVLLILVLANLLPRLRLSKAAILAAAAITVAMIGPNLVLLKVARNSFQTQSEYTRADTAAIEVARRTVAPEFQLTPEVAGTLSLVNIYAGAYLEAVDEYGSPAYDRAELESAPETIRRQADIVLGQALPLSTVTRLDAYRQNPPRPDCHSIDDDTAPASGFRVPSGVTSIEVAPGPRASFSLRRFAVAEFPVPTEGAPGDSVTALHIPGDESRKSWFLRVEAQQPFRICG